MSEVLSREQFISIYDRMLAHLEASSDRLRELDAAAGDGDLGVTITLGCGAIRKALPTFAAQDIGMIVSRSGMAFNSAAPSTFGALFAIGSMRAGKEAKGATEVDLPLMARMIRAAEQGIMEKGGAQRGDKTLLDSLGPSADSLDTAVSEGKSFAEAVSDALNAARAGAEATKQMTAKSGRSAWISERNFGLQDPGATVIVTMWEGVADAIK